jgi:hypothetical protein
MKTASGAAGSSGAETRGQKYSIQETLTNDNLIAQKLVVKGMCFTAILFEFSELLFNPILIPL